MSDPQDATEIPVGAVDTAGQPTAAPGITPPEQPPMLDDDQTGEINGETDDLQVQGGE